MPTDIFSTYSTGENRVTASILAVLQNLSLERIERVLGELLEQPELELVRFHNQPSRGGEGVPDAVISSSFRLLVETKIRPHAVRKDQLQRHLQRLEKGTEAYRCLLLLTPDVDTPPEVAEIDSPLLSHTSFVKLNQVIDELLADRREVFSEREAFLLRELQAMLIRENLLAPRNDVVVVAARRAWPEYQRYHAYVCQPDRAFQRVERMGFYSQGRIHSLIPRIVQTHERVEFVRGKHSGILDHLICRMLDEGVRQEGEAHKVILLSPPTSTDDTIDLGKPILNDVKAEGGRPWAFTLSQRYISLERLKRATTTRDILAEPER